jgi:hypothetical protein
MSLWRRTRTSAAGSAIVEIIRASRKGIARRGQLDLGKWGGQEEAKPASLKTTSYPQGVSNGEAVSQIKGRPNIERPPGSKIDCFKNVPAPVRADCTGLPKAWMKNGVPFEEQNLCEFPGTVHGWAEVVDRSSRYRRS